LKIPKKSSYTVIVVMITLTLAFNLLSTVTAPTIPGFPHHAQTKYYYCGPACLDMVFDFYGPRVSQTEIADAADTDIAIEGTFTSDLRRAAHFSDLSTSVGNEMAGSVTGYTARSLGYAAFDTGLMSSGGIDALKPLIDAGYPIIVLQWEFPLGSDPNWGHFRVVTGYDDATQTIYVDDPNPNPSSYTYDEFNDLWSFSSNRWGLFVSPWEVSITGAPANVAEYDTFTVTATVTYPCPSPFPSGSYPASSSQATIVFSSTTGTIGLSLDTGETFTKTLGTGTMAGGSSTSVQWNVKATDDLGVPEAGTYGIMIVTQGQVSGSSSGSGSYTDRIGGASAVDVTVQGEVGWIEGTVTDADTTLAIMGATVTADGVSDVTDASGFYSVEVSPGTYDVTAEMTGYVSETVTGVSVVADATVVQDIALTPEVIPPEPSIESSDAAGNKKDKFNPSDTVYVYGSQYGTDQEYDVYVVADASWTDGMSIPARIAGTATTVTSDASGNIPAGTQVWSSPLVPGKYDIVVDLNSNGQYDTDIDALDDNDIQVTAGFFVIPEYAFGTILGLIAFFAALGVFVRHKRTQTKM
jgi:hypothetical protein